MNFNLMQIFEERQGVERFVCPIKSSFENIDETGDYRKKETFYEYKIEKTDDFIWFSFDYGKTNPRDEKLTNTETGEKRDNPRNENEVEETNQFFVFYQYKSYLYISNGKKTTFFKEFLKAEFDLKVEIKNIMIQKEEFLETIKEVSTVEFTDAENLFNQNSIQRQGLIDLTGTDAPTNFTIIAKYSQGFFRKITSFLKGLKNDKLIIKGFDESGFERIYNAETFSKKIQIYVQKNENGKYDLDTVKTNLLQKITNTK